MATTDASTPSGTFRLLVVAAEEISGGALRDAVSEHVEGRETAVRLIAPALTESGLEHAMGDVDDALAAARERLEHSAAELGRAGIEAEAAVGDADLRLAIQDALQTFDADEILIVAHRDGGPYLERRGIEEAEREFEPPITELFVERHEGGEPTVAEVEHIGPGRRRADPGEREPESRNLPPFSPRDLIGIVVAIVGTIVLVVIAASGSDDLSGAGGLSSQSVQILIAGGMGLVNLAHVVGLTLFQTVSYRGLGPDFFARLSLYGTPIAIVISLLLG
ncbi:MAG: hypothetical protein ACRDLO_01860 [Solirubrobacterales bacterium]